MARYGNAMIDDPAWPETMDSVDLNLRERLIRDEAVAAGIVPVLRHLLAGDDNAIFADAIVARVRGMLTDIARQLLDSRLPPSAHAEPSLGDEAAIAELSDALIASPAILAHLHALALEWQLTERLQDRLALDSVLPPLVQAMIASPEAGTAELAMRFLAAQARFGQSQRRMCLPLSELPGDLLHIALMAMRTAAGSNPRADAGAAAAESAIRAAYDESGSRLALMSRLVTGMGGGVVAALSIGHAGAAIFLTALAIASGQDRDVVALATSEAQIARFAVALRAAGLKSAALEEQFLAVHPDLSPPDGLDRLGSGRAAAILSAVGSLPGR